MTNLYESCLYDPSICKRYSLSLRFILLKLPNELNGYYEILRTIPINNGIKTVGLRMYLSLDQNDIIIEIRSQYLTYKYTIKLDLIQQPGKWINMQIFYYQDHPLTISIDGNTNLSNQNGTIMNEINSKLTADERLKQNLIIGRGIKMCISSMTLYDISNENNFDLIVNTVNSQICYTNMDMFEELKGSMNDYKNRTNYASKLENFIRPLLFPSISCIQNPDICSNNGMTMSMWIMINGFVNEEGENLDVKNNESLTAIILSTGPPDNPGILIQVSGQLENENLKLSLKTSIYTQNYLWQVDSNNALELGQWTNIAFSWFSQPEENSGSLEIYINGLRKQSSTIPTSMLNMNTELNDTSKVFIGSVYYNVNKNTTNSVNKVFATGGIANLAYWESKNVISCSKPRKTKKFLLGDCESDTDVPETVTCIMMQGCRQVDGLVCMDRTLPNLIQMASQANKLIYPSDFIKVLQISIELLQIYKPHQTTPTTTDNHNDISFGLNIISSTMNIIHSWYKNPITLNISYPTNTGNEMYHSQFQIKTNDQQNIQLNGALTILSILSHNNTTENLKIIDIPLDKFSSNVTHYQQNYIDNEQKDSYNMTTTSQLEIPLVFLIASPLYSVEFYTENHSYTTIQINYTVPLLRLNKYYSVYYYETTWRMKWMAYNAEKYNEGLLANEIRCVYWDDQLDTNGAWNTNGCQIIKSTKTHVQCSCNHLSLFAVAMESEDAPYRSVPIWKAWGTKSESECTMLMNIIIFGGNGLSLTCSLILILTLIIVWKKASIPDVCLTRMGLCLCQIGFHATLLIEPLINQYQIPCQAIGVSLNLFAILVSSWLSNEAISLFKSFVLGQLKLTYCWTWITGIVIPVSLVLIPAVVSKLNSQGGDLLCLPAHESLEFWIMFGSIFAYTIINIMVCFTLTCNIETPAFLSPKILDRLLTRVKKLNSLLLYYIITWSLLFVVIQLAIPYVVFVAFALVSLQGTWSFVIYGLEDRELFKACLRNTQKQRRSDNILETNKLSTDPVIKNTEKDELHITDQSSHHYNSTAVSQQHQDTRNDTRILQRNKSNKKDIE
ncbi:putative long-N-terminal adhesion GPCR [Schistosoma mansoni]|uniref:putative long-N-terminal adhesion GPCR n=1 Tax=Schistosoma mansoni TaxID=6183 RepID=UPI0001A63AFD|nr:putative long-N-terminal adhesion GPCR [Schistosoma mansoni]|eukprot:XP_018654801.1 putative long-N-terminal adhesion GPCR [Schistosoma mansoni]